MMDTIKNDCATGGAVVAQSSGAVPQTTAPPRYIPKGIYTRGWRSWRCLLGGLEPAQCGAVAR